MAEDQEHKTARTAAVQNALREDYKGFKAPRDMSPEQEGRWKAAIDERTKSTIPEAPGALATKALGDPSGMPPTATGDPALDPSAPRALMEAGSILPVGQAIQAVSDVGIMGSDLAKGDYPGAALSAGAVALPVSATVLKKVVGQMRPSVAKDIAQSIESVGTAGVEAGQPAAQTLARKEWVEKGTESPFFRAWSEDFPIVSPENLRTSSKYVPPAHHKGSTDRQRRTNSSMAHWWEGLYNPKKHTIGNFYSYSSRDRLKLMMDAPPTPLDILAAKPTVWRVNHATDSLKGDAINLRSSLDLGFHMGTGRAADSLRRSETLGLFFKSKKLVPLLDGWHPRDVAEEALAHAARVGDHTAARALAHLSVELKHTQMGLRDQYDLIRGTLRQHGYDGAVYVNAVEDAGSLSFITFSRLNVKLAEPSEALGAVRGTFGSTNPALAHGVGVGVGVPTAIAMREKAREGEGE